MSEWEERARILGAKWHECQRRETAQCTKHAIKTRGEGGTRNGKIKKRASIIFSPSISQSVSRSVSRQASKHKHCKRASKASQQASRQAHSFPPQRGPPPGNAHHVPVPVKSQTASPRKGVERDGRWRVGGWRIEHRGSTNQLPGGPHLELDTKGSLTRSSKSPWREDVPWPHGPCKDKGGHIAKETALHPRLHPASASSVVRPERAYI